MDLPLTEHDAPLSQVVGAHSAKDRQYWETLTGILERTPHSAFHLLNHWPVYTKRVSVARFLAHVKLFEKIQDMPGNIVELGVSRGVSFFTWHKLFEVFAPADTTRKVVGFDSFEGLTDFSEKDGAPSAGVDKAAGGWSAGDVERELFELTAMHNADDILARERCTLIKGRVQDTLPAFLRDTPGMRVALLHLDMDLYEPTRFALEHLWDLVLPGGVVVFDEFALPPWGGEVRAWEEFSTERGLAHLRVQKFPWSITPNGYVVKT